MNKYVYLGLALSAIFGLPALVISHHSSTDAARVTISQVNSAAAPVTDAPTPSQNDPRIGMPRANEDMAQATRMALSSQGLWCEGAVGVIPKDSRNRIFYVVCGDGTSIANYDVAMRPDGHVDIKEASLW